ncbi:MAG: hypothetical protein ABI317_16745 [Gaiellales bacterium]
MASLADQWAAILEAESEDWSHLALELRLADPECTEEVVVVLAPLNPWRRDDDYRSGVLRFRTARTIGYGAAPGLVGVRMRQLVGVEGELEVLRSVDADRPVATQGPSW